MSHKKHRMKRFGKRLGMIGAATAVVMAALAAGRLEAASPAEVRDYQGIIKDFKLNDWSMAEQDAAKFIANPKYTNSENFTNVVLMEAQAQYKQKKCNDMVVLLTAQQGRAGSLADEFTYLLGQAHDCASNYQEAADAFGRLVKDFPASPRRAEAIFSEAEARSRLQDWARVSETLNKPDGAFQQMARTNETNDWVVRGWLLLSEAQAKQNDYAGAEATLKKIPVLKANPALDWQRLYLLCDAQLAAGDKDEARQTSTNLVAGAPNKVDLARSMELQGRILEELDLLPEAVKAYLGISQTDGMPGERRRGAFLKAVELTWRQNKLDEAERMLKDYFTTHPELDEKGLETLTRGELLLKRYFQVKNGAPPAPGTTNSLAAAEAAFQEIVNGTNTEFIGKAELNLGWCYWEEKKYPESRASFLSAAQRLPFSVDRAVAQFKVGDALFQMGDFAGAAANYNTVIERYSGLTGVRNDVLERTLYQLVRAGLEQTNLNLAGSALKRILEWYPEGLLGQPSLLLVGQGFSSQGKTADARKVFQDFIERFPQSDLLPEVKLAIARTYEAERDWPSAMTAYDAWVKTYTNSATLPRAEFARAQVNYEAGRETNAFVLFTNFVARFPTSELALKAQYWIGDFYWRQPDYVSAEAQYQEVYKNKNWPASKLQYEALMMAGRAAMMRENYGEAFGYFTNLFSITNCPLDLRWQASFAAGDAKMFSAVTASVTNFPAYQEAIDYYFMPITDGYQSNRIAALAWGRVGDCCLLLAAGDAGQFKRATNAYQQVMNSPLADIPARSMAECGLAKALASMALLKPVGTQREGLMEAVGHYYNVVKGANRRDNEVADPYWVKEAGKAAGALLEEEPVRDLDKAAALYSFLAEDLPSWKSYWNKQLEKMREKQPAEKPPEKN
jgi:TolA-binding protein